MNKMGFFPAMGFLLILGNTLAFINLQGAGAASSVSQKTLTLYDAASGEIPKAPLMNFTVFPPGGALPAYSDAVTVLDTTTAGRDTYAGWISSRATTPGFPVLERTAGFKVNFTLQVKRESHANNDRAGFSVIILGEDAKGIELAFWQNEIWVQSDEVTGGLFKHGEGAAFAANADLIEYQVAIVGDTYTLRADAKPILSGSVRDYSKFDGFPDPYETPNFLFLGDDTTSSQARVLLSFVSIVGTEPVEPIGTASPTSTSTPFRVASYTPLPSATPVPSPTPTGKAFELCPSGWIFLAVAITVSRFANKLTGQATDLP